MTIDLSNNQSLFSLGLQPKTQIFVLHQSKNSACFSFDGCNKEQIGYRYTTISNGQVALFTKFEIK